MKVGDLVQVVDSPSPTRSSIGIVLARYSKGTATVYFPKRNETFECWMERLEPLDKIIQKSP